MPLTECSPLPGSVSGRRNRGNAAGAEALTAIGLSGTPVGAGVAARALIGGGVVTGRGATLGGGANGGGTTSAASESSTDPVGRFARAGIGGGAAGFRSSPATPRLYRSAQSGGKLARRVTASRWCHCKRHLPTRISVLRFAPAPT